MWNDIRYVAKRVEAAVWFIFRDTFNNPQMQPVPQQIKINRQDFQFLPALHGDARLLCLDIAGHWGSNNLGKNLACKWGSPATCLIKKKRHVPVEMLAGGPEGGVTLQLTRCVHCFHPPLSLFGSSAYCLAAQIADLRRGTLWHRVET